MVINTNSSYKQRETAYHEGGPRPYAPEAEHPDHHYYPQGGSHSQYYPEGAQYRAEDYRTNTNEEYRVENYHANDYHSGQSQRFPPETYNDSWYVNKGLEQQRSRGLDSPETWQNSRRNPEGPHSTYLPHEPHGTNQDWQTTQVTSSQLNIDANTAQEWQVPSKRNLDAKRGTDQLASEWQNSNEKSNKVGAGMGAATDAREPTGNYNNYRAVVVNANGDSTVLPPGTTATTAQRGGSFEWCCGGGSSETDTHTETTWIPWCRPAIFLLVLVLLVLVFVLISGILFYFNYTNYKPKKNIIEDPCVKTFCAWGATCVNQADGRAQCLCPTECPPVQAPVCGSDGRTYASHCQLRVSSCQRKRNTRVVHPGECELIDPCREKQCGFGARCVPTPDGRNATCQCPERCPSFGDHARSRPVCATDGRDYQDQCELRKHACTTNTNITVKFFGKCDPCAGVECSEPEICQLDDQRQPVCRCGDACPLEFTPVCGSDGKTYSNECSLRQEACRARRPLRIIYRGKCSSGVNPCLSVRCIMGEECAINKFGIARCECLPDCEPVMRPVCSKDGRTFSSECEMKRAACMSRTTIQMDYTGVCGKKSPCGDHACHHGAVCVERAGTAHCECPVCPAEFNPVCGSDGISYGNECKLRLESCKHRRDISILYDGPCSGCENKKCEFYSTCESEGATEGHCVCPETCENTQEIDSSVCGSNGATYPSECLLKIASCKLKQHIQISYKGNCDLCQEVECKFGARCEAGKCVCPTDCEGSGSEPVCASSMVTYRNDCELQKTACLLPPEAPPLDVIFYGDCRERFVVTGVFTTILPDTSNSERVSPLEVTSITEASTVPEREACKDIHCDYEATCELGPDNFPRCTCHFDCSSPAVIANSKPVCASDMRMYPSLCAMKMEACQRQEELRLRPLDLCQGMEVKPCNGEQPLKDLTTSKELDCGNGPNRQDCPSGSYCHQTTRFAKCCQKSNYRKSKTGEDLPHEDQNLVQKVCEDSWFGCCPDGKTPAQGANHAGCPSLCACNKLGSYSDTCDPITQQCQCRPGVGGLKCDRCEPGYWGLPKISSGHQGCIPCGCSVFGSVREDCEQMTGRCVCKSGIQGQKCTICTSLNKILGPNGCASIDTSTPPPATCKELNCYFGAICVERSGFAICECHVECPEETDSQNVCGSDGQTYLSECRLKLMACRMQKDIVVQAFGTCKDDIYAGTDWPIRRYTPMHFTQPDDSNSPLSKSTRHLLSPDPRFYYERGSSLVRAPPLDSFRDLNNIASPKMNRYPPVFHNTKGENYAAAYRPTPATVHVVTALLGDLCSDNADCSIIYSECLGGACVCPVDFNESPDRQECISHNLTVSGTSPSREYYACKSSPCSLGSTCIDLPTAMFTCLCSANSTGPLCETEIITKSYEIPSFNGYSHVKLHSMRAYHKLSIEMEIKSYAYDGILLYNQQKADGSGDFVSLAIIKGFIEFRYNLGNGVVIIRSMDKIHLTKYHKIVIKRYHKDGMLKLDNGEDIIGQSQGNLKALDLNEEAFIGNVPTNFSKVYDNIGTNQGFIGCIKKVKIGRRLVELHEHIDDLVIETSSVQECENNPCLSVPCQNGGSCYVVDKDVFTCKCNPSYAGVYCDQISTSVNESYIPEFTGTSYIQFPQLKRVGKTFTIDISFMPKSANGLLLYDGQLKNGRGDFISLLLVHGFIQFRFNLGSGIANITSTTQVKIGKWHWVKIHRNGRYGSLQLDNLSEVLGTSGPPLTELNLELPFYIGSVPAWLDVHRLTGASKGFRGAIQRVTLNGNQLPIPNTLPKCTSKPTDFNICVHGIEKYEGSPCPTTHNPCLNGGLCVPNLGTYICQCSNNHRGKHCETSMNDESWPVKFTGKTFLQYRTRGIKNTNNSITDNTYSQNLQSDYLLTESEDNNSTMDSLADFDESIQLDYDDNYYYSDNIDSYDSLGRKNERTIKYEIKFRTTSLNGLLLWRSKNKSFNSEYLAVAVVEGYPELSYNLGKQESFWAIRSPVRVNDGKWHSLYVRRRKRVGFISVDDSLPVRGLSSPGSIILNTNNKLWLGGSPSIPSGFPAAYYKGFQGCIKHLYINVKPLNLSRTHDAAILHHCHDNDI